MNTVSVVLPCFNARAWIREAVESVFAQEWVDVEVVIVDDGSTDGSGDVAAQAFPSVRVVRVENGGPSRARNLGTRLSRGAFIQYLDADDVLAAGKLHAQVAALSATGGDVAYGDWWELRRGPDGAYWKDRRIARRLEGEPAIALLSDFWCPPAAYLFRRDIVDRVGGWDDEQHVVEDVRFLLRCVQHGAAFVYCEGEAASYRVHADGSQSTRDRSAFARGCLRNAVMMERWWRSHGGLDSQSVDVLLKVYGQVARASFGRDGSTFESAYAALQRLKPGSTPVGPWQLELASRLFGYRSAEAIALRYRRVKRTVKSALQFARQ
jgi:GT2 family glycosyltransferase